jgi:hypothetical protein
MVHSPTRPEYGGPWPSVLAHYTHREGVSETQWRVWRDSQRHIREYPHNGTAELWTVDGNGVFHTKYFHADRQAIEFQPTDLAMLGAAPEWQDLQLLVSAELLSALPVVSQGKSKMGPWVRQRGMHGGSTWDITMGTDLMLPLKLRRQKDGATQELLLTRAMMLTDADWAPESVAGYRHLEYSDLGDYERDPFVAQVHGLLFPEHTHEH